MTDIQILGDGTAATMAFYLDPFYDFIVFFDESPSVVHLLLPPHQKEND